MAALIKAGALAGLLVAVADGQLAANGVGQAHEKCDNDLKSICASRTHRGNKPSVLIDVPKACAGERSTCPVAFFFHGIGSNEKHTGRACRPAPPTPLSMLAPHSMLAPLCPTPPGAPRD